MVQPVQSVSVGDLIPELSGFHPRFGQNSGYNSDNSGNQPEIGTVWPGCVQRGYGGTCHGTEVLWDMCQGTAGRTSNGTEGLPNQQIFLGSSPHCRGIGILKAL